MVMPSRWSIVLPATLVFGLAAGEVRATEPFVLRAMTTAAEEKPTPSASSATGRCRGRLSRSASAVSRGGGRRLRLGARASGRHVRPGSGNAAERGAGNAYWVQAAEAIVVSHPRANSPRTAWPSCCVTAKASRRTFQRRRAGSPSRRTRATRRADGAGRLLPRRARRPAEGPADGFRPAPAGNRSRQPLGDGEGGPDVCRRDRHAEGSGRRSALLDLRHPGLSDTGGHQSLGSL